MNLYLKHFQSHIYPVNSLLMYNIEINVNLSSLGVFNFMFTLEEYMKRKTYKREGINQFKKFLCAIMKNICKNMIS